MIYDTKSIIDNENLLEMSSMDTDLRVQGDNNLAESTTKTPARSAFTSTNNNNNENPFNVASGKKNDPTTDTQLNSHKTALIQDFSRLMKFLKDLVQADRKFLKINPVRISFYTLIKIDSNYKNTDTTTTTTTSKSQAQQRSRFLFNLVQMFSQIDANRKQDSLCKVQETILGFVEFLIRLMPDLFLDQMRPQDFLPGSATSSITTTASQNINTFMIESLLSNMSKLSFDPSNSNKSVTITSMMLSLLVLLNKLYVIYFSEKCPNSDKTGVLNPIVSVHVSDAGFSLTQLINELISYLANLSNNTRAASNFNTFINSIFYDLLTKFFIYTGSLIDNLTANNHLSKLKVIFNWSNKSTQEMLIDSISTSDSFATTTGYQHPLTVLDKRIETLLFGMTTAPAISKDDSQLLNRKLRFCLNQSKRLIKILNEYDQSTSKKSTVNSIGSNLTLTCSDFDANYGFKIDSSDSCFRGNLNQDELAIYFRNRSVYIHSMNRDELRAYETEWLDVNVLNDMGGGPSNVNFDDAEVSYEDVLASFHGNLIPNSLLTLPIETNLVRDKDFLNKLIKTIEEEGLKKSRAKRPFDELTVDQIVHEDKQFDYEKLNRIKNERVVNTRTGIRYKAPMRGGQQHNQIAQQNQQRTNPASVNTVSSTVGGSSSGNLANNGNNGSGGGGTMNGGSMMATGSSGMTRSDSFRVRAANTSRAPSLHVDEYYRMENAQKESLANTRLVEIM
jgi:hypothetical protein